MSLTILIGVFLGKYLVPFLFAIGLFYFIYACIRYFIIGLNGDEGNAEHGRELFLKSAAWFVIGIAVQCVVIVFGWISAFDFSLPTGMPNGGAGAEVRQEQNVLEVPNVPTR